MSNSSSATNHVRQLPGQRSRTNTQDEYWNRGFNATNYYRQRVAAAVEPGQRILHAGCGWDKTDISRNFKEQCKVVGIDSDPRVAEMFHSEFRLGSLTQIPFEANSFDVVISEYVLEHLEDPEAAFAEIGRVLAPGGRFLVLTPNVFSYKSIAARVTPHWFHVAMGRIRYGRGHEEDMYPTYFRCNSSRLLTRCAERHGLTVRSIELITNGPTWFERFPVAYAAFHRFHVAIERLAVLKHLRCAIIAEFQKPDEG